MYPSEFPDEDYGTLATMADAVKEWARNVGYLDRYKDSQWLLHDYDVWTLNPHYTGPKQPHPDSDYTDNDIVIHDDMPDMFDNGDDDIPY